MPRSTQITDNEGQFEDLVGSSDILISVTANNLEGDESEDDELGERTASDSSPSRLLAVTDIKISDEPTRSSNWPSLSVI
jgi:hypothetical protein